MDVKEPKEEPPKQEGQYGIESYGQLKLFE
jgi:hypothetical protein